MVHDVDGRPIWDVTVVGWSKAGLLESIYRQQCSYWRQPHWMLRMACQLSAHVAFAAQHPWRGTDNNLAYVHKFTIKIGQSFLFRYSYTRIYIYILYWIQGRTESNLQIVILLMLMPVLFPSILLLPCWLVLVSDGCLFLFFFFVVAIIVVALFAVKWRGKN